MRRRDALIFSCSLLLLSGGCGNGYVRRNEEVTFFPTCANHTSNGREWVVPIHGWIYQPEQQSLNNWLVLNLLTTSLDLNDQNTDTPAFQNLAQRFLVDNVPNRSFMIRLGEQEHRVGSSRDNGHFKTTLKLPVEEVERFLRTQGAHPERLEFTAKTAAGDSRKIRGSVQFVDDQGVSVVSDVDDTIKITEVNDRSEMLKNTFLKEFRAVPGMADLYRGWAQLGACFHYLTASPWQLYADLEKFQRKHGFPLGSFQMNMFDWRSGDISELLSSPHDMKIRYLQGLIKAYPRRKFILVGDSGQEDPEIYAEIAREFPKRVEHIFIRELGEETAESRRCRSAFDGVAPSRCTVFRDPADIRHYQLPGGVQKLVGIEEFEEKREKGVATRGFRL